MSTLTETAPAFVAMAHRIVWCSVATVAPDGRPRSRVLHPLWEWDGENLVGWIATGPTPLKRSHLDHSPFVSCNYWAPDQDTCVAECRATWIVDDDGRQALWDRFVQAPEPVGYDLSIFPAWSEGPLAPAFAGLLLEPWHLRVFPAAVLQGGGEVLTWTSAI
jgi:hypothetical protein